MKLVKAVDLLYRTVALVLEEVGGKTMAQKGSTDEFTAKIGKRGNQHTWESKRFAGEVLRRNMGSQGGCTTGMHR